MNGLTAARAEVVDLLEDGLTVALSELGVQVLDHVPEELAPPCVVIDAGDDYLTRGETYDEGQWWLTLRVYAFVDLTANAQATEDLEALLAAILPALAGSEWEVDPIGRPEEFHTLTWLAHGTRITVRNLITIQGDNP